MTGRIVVPQSYVAMRGPGCGWLATLPALVEARCHEWNLTIDGQVTHGSNALVVPVVRDAEPLVLRMFPPGPSTSAEVAALQFWDGRGAVRLIDADIDVAAMLLERLRPGTPASVLPVDACMRVMGRMMRRLAVAPPRDAPSTARLAAARRASLGPDWVRLGRPFPVAVLRAAERAADDLSDAREDLAVDGDLHPDQILQATREPWLAVDLVLYRGDIEYDLARILWDRIDDMPTDAAVSGHFHTLVQAAELDMQRARAWVTFRAVDYWLWGLDHDLTSDPMRCARLITALPLS